MNSNYIPCSQCGARLMFCFLKDGICNGCRNPHLIVTAVVEHKPCDEHDCTECCPHDERDHGICSDCGEEQDPGEAIDRAMDYIEGCND